MSAQGRAEISRIQVPYLDGFQNVEFKLVKTLKQDGTVTVGDPSTAFDTAPSGDQLVGYFTDLKYTTIIPPSVDTGDTVDYEYVQHIDRWPKPGDFWFTHYATTQVPVISETVVLDLPAERRVSLYEGRTVAGKTETVRGRRVERWVTQNTDVLKPNPDGAEPVFAVSSLASWEALGGWIFSLNEPAVRPTPEIRELAIKLTASKDKEEDKIAAIYGYVATKVRYVAVEYGVGRFQPHPASVVLHNRYGDCKDQTALLSALLTAAGFETHAVLTTPGAGVRIRDVPTPEQFNHEFTAVDTKFGPIFLDTSMGPTAPQTLGPGVRGRAAMMIGEGKSELVQIPERSPVPNRMTTVVRGKLNAAGFLEGMVRFELQGYSEVYLRQTFLDGTAGEKEKALSDIIGTQIGGAAVRQVASGDPGDLTKAFWASCEFSAKDFFPPSRSSIRVAESAGQLATSLFERIGKPEKPTAIDAVIVTETMDLQVDPAFVVVNGVPVHRKEDFGGFDSEYQYHDGHLLLRRSFELTGSEIAPADWSRFLKFLAAVAGEETRGFSLERQPRALRPGASDLSRAMRDGAAAFQKLDYEAAKRAYLEATELDPQSRTAWNSLGRAYAALHEYTKAEAAYKRQIAVNPQDPYAYNNLGVTYRALKREDDAIAAFEKQIAINPKDRYAHDNLSISLAAKQQWERSRAEASMAVEITPQDPLKWAHLGRAQAKMGNIEDARKSFQQVLALVHDGMTENNISYYMADAGFDLELAWKLVSGTLDPAARQVCEPESVNDRDACTPQLRSLSFMLDTAGWILYRQGKLMEAEPYIISSYAVSPRAATEVHLAIVMAKTGRMEKALKYFADASSREDFAPADAVEARRELAANFGSDEQFDTRLNVVRTPAAKSGPIIRVTALVDARGKVLETRPADPLGPAAITAEAKSMTLPPIEWPGHSIRSLRVIELRQDDGKWVVAQSYAGEASKQSGN